MATTKTRSRAKATVEDEGMLLRGADGKLYYIKKKELSVEAISEEKQRCFVRCLRPKILECLQQCGIPVSNSDSFLMSLGLFFGGTSQRKRR